MKFSPSQKLNVSMLVLAFSILFVPGFILAAPSALVIDEFRIDSAVSDKDEYIVVANYGPSERSLTQLALTIKTSNTTYQYLYRFLLDSVIAPNQKVKVCHTLMIENSTCDFFYPATTSYEMKSDGLLAIIDLANAKKNIDLVGYGEIDYGAVGCWATGCENYPLESPSRGTVYRRIDGQDTDVSTSDFEGFVPHISIDANIARLVISELLPNPDGGKEWFELHNPTNQSIGLVGLKICDSLGSRHCYVFDKADVLSPGAYKKYDQTVTKITLNNSGDWLELYDVSDNLITESGGDYGSADKGVSIALFGTDYQWTKSLTPGAPNIFTDTIELETDTELPTPKTPKTKATVAKKTVVVATSSDDETPRAEVKAAEAGEKVNTEAAKPINREVLGWALIGLAMLLVVGYTFWYFRDYAKKIYDKIRHRDDSARF